MVDAILGQRPWHQLARVKGNCCPARAIFVSVQPLIRDAGSGVSEHTFLRGFASASYLKDGVEQSRLDLAFARTQDFWGWLDRLRSRRQSTWVFSHNMGYTLSLLGFWDTLERGGDELVYAVIEDPPTIVVTRRCGRLIRYVDTLNYWRCSLGELGRAFGFRSDAGAFDQGIATEWQSKSHKNVRIIQQTVLGVLSRFGGDGIGTFATTAAACAWNAYRRNFLTAPIWVHGHERALALERAAIFGGRQECRRQGHVKEPVSVWDANSLYPWIMKSQPQPAKLHRYWNGCCPQILRQVLSSYTAVARVSLGPGSGIFPYKKGNRTYFSSVGGQTVLCGAELLAAFEACFIHDVCELATYEPADLFTHYVDHFYALKTRSRQEGNTADELFAKMMLVGLSGKFGQRQRRWVDDPEEPAADRYASWWVAAPDGAGATRYRSIAGRSQRHVCGGETRHSCPAVVACITAGGRDHLARSIELAGDNTILYADTDALHTLRDGELRLLWGGAISDERLGAFKGVARGNDAYYWSPKHYRVGSRWVCNVLAATAREVSAGVWLQENGQGLQHRLETGQLSSVLTEKRTKHIDRAGYPQDQELARVTAR